MHPQTATTGQREPERGPRERDRNRWGSLMQIKLKAVMYNHCIAARELGDCVINKQGRPLDTSTIYQVCNRGVLPTTNTPDFKAQVEAFLTERCVPENEIDCIWLTDDCEIIPINRKPKDIKYRQRLGEAKKKGESIAELLKEATMLTPTAMKHFKLFKNPFLNDTNDESDVYLSASHRYAMAAMEDAARNGGFVAVTGECGGGKSVLRRMLVQRLLDGGEVRVIQPQILDKKNMNAGHILDAIVDDITPGAKVRASREAKARQVRKLLIDSSNTGQRHVLIIEEAHDLTVATMKLLKRLWEIERGMSKVLGIVLIGQQELRLKLNMRANFEMREVILRCLLASLEPLDADLEDYVEFKLKRIGATTSDILAGGWAGAVRNRLTNNDGFSALYPLHIHNLLARAMNKAAEFAEPRVTAEIIKSA